MRKFICWKLAFAALAICAVLAVAAPAQTFTTLVDFNGANGVSPWSLVRGRDGSLYGTTEAGGSNGVCDLGCGTLFKLTSGGTLKVLYSFDGTNGAEPGGGLTLGTDGNFYGTTISGGASGHGTIFKFAPGGNGVSLYSFTGDNGPFPAGPPIQGTDGNFYGTTIGGTVYKITASGAFTQLASLPGQSNAPLMQATDGNFYGTTTTTGSSGNGTVFRMTPTGTVTVVYNFDYTHGANPYSPLIQASDGSLYGTTAYGGTGGIGDGTVFKITSSGTLTVLHNFSYGDGSTPYGGLVQATDGNLYGTTAGGGTNGFGTVFTISFDGILTTLHSFDNTDGSNLMAGLLQYTNGSFYGTTFAGGTDNAGTLFNLSTGLGPFISFVSGSGKIGQTGGILGQGFIGTTSVLLNGTPAPFTVQSDTFILATVPAGATSGYVTVTAPGGTLTSNKPFQVIP